MREPLDAKIFPNPAGFCRLHPRDASFEHHEHKSGPITTLEDEEGHILFTFSGHLTSDLLERILQFANNSYDKGHQAGQRAKAREIQRALTCD